jgi:hypothetical protein
MNLFRILKKQPRQASDVPTASSTPNTSSHPVDSEILVQGADPITAE